MSEPEARGAGFLLRSLETSIIGEVDAEILREAAAVLDLINDLQAELARAGAIIDGKPNPVAVELRQQRLVLARLLAMLPPQEPSAAPVAPESPRTRRARHAAEKRWSDFRARRGLEPA